jgi:PAS domain S-box-containing protein
MRQLSGGGFLADTSAANPNWLDDYIPPEDHAAVTAAIRNAIGLKEVFQLEHRVRLADGGVGWTSSRAVPLLDADGAVTEWFGAAADVTARRNAEEALQRLNANLEREVADRTRERDEVWRVSEDMLLVIGKDGVIRSVNPAWTRTLGYAPHELVGRRFDAFIEPSDIGPTVMALEQAALAVVSRFENCWRHKDDSWRNLSWTAAPSEDLIYCVARDVTQDRRRERELAEAQDALRQAQKMEAVGQLTGGVAHDFNNLLTVIKSSTDLLKRPNLAEERRQRYIGAISDTVGRAAKLTGQLLAFARRQALRPEVFDVGQGVAALSDMIGTLTGSRIQIVTDVPDDSCFVNADPSQFDTAVVNMAVNARDAMDGEGRLAITVHPVSTIPAIRSHPPVSGDFVAVCIEDTGSGIPADKIEHIFEPFFTTKGVGQGTGLGLSQVFGFAKQSGGEVRVQSEVGKGTMFVLYLPRVAAEAAAPESEPEPLIDGHGTRVLVVEDNVDVGTFATQTLAELGYVTTWATNAKEALIELAKAPGAFDVVFSDVVMPGMNGIDLGHEIRRLYHDLPVVLASGYSHVLAQNGTYGFELLHKPYSVEQLSRTLRKVATWRRRRRILAV